MKYIERILKRGAQGIKKFLTTDIVIIDKVLRLEESEALQEFVKRKGYMPGQKHSITKEEFEELQAITTGMNITNFPGGSASNMIRTMSKLSHELVDGTFVGTVDSGSDGVMIERCFKEAKVNLKLAKNGVAPETAVSFVIKYPNGERVIVTYPGNARAIIKPEHFTSEMVAESDAILLQGSIARKFDHEVIDGILKHRWDHHKQLVLALPTSAFKPDYFWAVEQSANVVLSNTDELGHVVGCKIEEARKKYEKACKKLEAQPDNEIKQMVVEKRKEVLDDQIAEALSKLQQQQRDISDVTLKKHGFGPQVAFITDGQNGAYVVTSKSVRHVNSVPDEKIPDGIVNKLGAGDNSFAGFVFGLLVLNYEPVKAAEFAMKVAAAKLQFDGPVMANPWKEIAKIDPVKAGFHQRDVEAVISELNGSITR